MSIDINLKTSQNNQPVAIAYPSKDIIYTVDKSNGIKEIYEPEQKFKLLPNIRDNMRDVLFITGASGAGKSTFINSYAQEYLKVFPSHKIYVFSKFENDESCPYLERKQVTYIPHEKIKANYIEIFALSAFKNSLVIFDDIEAILSADVKYRVTQIMNMLLTSGRHEKVSMAVSMHQSNNWNQTKLILNESTHAIFFPGSNFAAIQKYLRNNLGLIRAQIDKVKSLKSRWVCVSKAYPMYVLYEHGIYLL